MSVLVQAQALSKTYPGAERPVFQNLDLELKIGSSLSIMGASGAGKSTLLHIIGTLDRPTSGQVRFQGEDLFRYSDEKLAQFRNSQLGFVFQFHHLLAEFTALENVMLPLLIRGESAKQRRQQAETTLAAVGLAAKFDSLPNELSGGEQQRVAVARAVVTKPKLLLADEPTGNLDRQTGELLMDLLFDLNKRQGLTLVFVTHNEELARRAERQVYLRDGRLQ